MRPNLCLPPELYCPGTRPSQALKLRPQAESSRWLFPSGKGQHLSRVRLFQLLKALAARTEVSGETVFFYTQDAKALLAYGKRGAKA